MKDCAIYNASDFPVKMEMVLPPNTGISLSDLEKLITEKGYVCLIDNAEIAVGAERLQKESVDVKITLV